MLTLAHRYPPKQFALFRMLFGTALCLQFVHYVPFAGDLFGPNGPSPAHLAWPLPNVFTLAQRPWELRSLFSLAALLAACLAAGLLRRTCAALLAFLWMNLLARTVYITVPSDGYVGWFLVALAIVPIGEPLSLGRYRAPTWGLPTGLVAAAWAVVSCSYTASGVDKLSSPNWRSGDALAYVLQSPVSRGDWVAELAEILPGFVLTVGTYFALGLEILYVPLAIFGATRKYLWIATVLLHLGVLATLAIPGVSIMMLIIHLFLYDHRWNLHPAVFDHYLHE